jgi:hypothetical protein
LGVSPNKAERLQSRRFFLAGVVVIKVMVSDLFVVTKINSRCETSSVILVAVF